MSFISSLRRIMRYPDKLCLTHFAACSEATVSSSISGHLVFRHIWRIPHFGSPLKTRWHGIFVHEASHSSAGLKRSLYTSKSVGSNSGTAPAMSGAE
jgi:hypothetical protein